MAEVINIFTKQPIEVPAAAESDFVADLESDLAEMSNIFNEMLTAETEEEFRSNAADIKEMLVRWGI